VPALPRTQQTVQVLYRFVMQLGVVPLNGSSSLPHIKADLEVLEWDQPLSDEEMGAISALFKL
jgi:diketogulonate reductase-like aldo/keto reductase